MSEAVEYPAPPMDETFRDLVYREEAAVIGSILLEPELAGTVLLELADRDFLTPVNRLLYQAIRRQFDRGLPVDGLTMDAATEGKYSRVLAEIIECTPTSANCAAYVRLLKEHAALHHLRQAGDRLLRAQTLEEARACLDEANRMQCQRPGLRRMGMQEGYEAFLDRHGDGAEPDWMPWGFADLDAHIHAAPGDMVVLGGYSSDGKTALALQWAFLQAASRRVAFFEFEDDSASLYDRLVANRAGIPLDRIKRSAMTVQDFSAVVDLRGPLTEPTLDLYEAAGMTAADIQAVSRSGHYDVVYIDYLQHMQPPAGRRNQSLFERVTETSSALQQFARQTGIILVALSQLSRPERTRSGDVPAPTMASLRQSGQIEQDAKIILLLYREDSTTRYSPRILKIEKNKEGRAGMALRLRFDGEHQRFEKADSPGQSGQPDTEEKEAQISLEELPAETELPQQWR